MLSLQDTMIATETSCRGNSLDDSVAKVADMRPPIRLPGYDDQFHCNSNTLNGYRIGDVYHGKLLDTQQSSQLVVSEDGGFSIMFRGRHCFIPGTPVAIKMIRFEVCYPEQSRIVQKMEQQVAELDALRELRNSAHILHLHEYFVDQASSTSQPERHFLKLCLVTELMKGGSLRDCIETRHQQQNSRFTEREGREVLGKLLDAVEFMHSRNIVHRDLTAENLLLSCEGCATTLKIAGFRCCKRLTSSEETLETMTGTPGYRAPEVWSGASYYKSVDLFAIGTILFYLLAGYHPFACSDEQEIAEKTIQGDYMVGRMSWLRISCTAKNLVYGLMATNPKYRLDIQGAWEQPWMMLTAQQHEQRRRRRNHK